MMKDIDIARLKELAERATPGEWQVDADASHIRIVTADDACVYPFWLTPTPNKEANAAYIVAASPDVVLALIEEVDYWRGYAETLEQEKGAYYVEFDRLAEELGVFGETDPGHPESFAKFAEVYRNLRAEVERLRAREADYRQYLAGIRQGLELREADEKENEKELEKALDEVERLEKLSELWKHDYENLASSANDARKKVDLLEKEADWLAEELAESRGECPYANDPDYWDDICRHENCVDNVMACWRAAARRSVEEECKS